MSDVSGQNPVRNLTLTFSDSAPGTIPVSVMALPALSP